VGARVGGSSEKPSSLPLPISSCRSIFLSQNFFVEEPEEARQGQEERRGGKELERGKKRKRMRERRKGRREHFLL